MAFPIRYLVPYECTLRANDLGSGKTITNKLYYQTQLQTLFPPAYGGEIAGAGSTATLLASIISLWTARIIPRLNANYVLNLATMKAIIGKRYSTPLLPIASLAPGLVTTIDTGTPHGLVPGNLVYVQGVTTPASANGVFVANILTTTTFSLGGLATTGSWSGDGVVQLASGKLEFLYTDLETSAALSVAGGVTGDAMPLFATASIRRLNSGIGRHFRSRFSLSPMSEVDALDGGFTTVQKGFMATALTAFNLAIVNGGTDATSGYSQGVVVSKALAFTQASPFLGFSAWASFVTSLVQQRNMGSLVRRKPKLASIIT